MVSVVGRGVGMMGCCAGVMDVAGVGGGVGVAGAVGAVGVCV